MRHGLRNVFCAFCQGVRGAGCAITAEVRTIQRLGRCVEWKGDERRVVDSERGGSSESDGGAQESGVCCVVFVPSDPGLVLDADSPGREFMLFFSV